MIDIRKTLTSTEMLVVYIIVAFSLLIGFVNPAFFTLGTVFDTLRAMLITTIFALCEMVAIISGGIDVSFPAITCFSSYITISLMNSYHINNIALTFLLAGVIGLLWGTLNGLLIAKFQIPALIATLGTSSLVNGLALIISGGIEISNIPSSVDALSQIFILSVKNGTGGKASLTVFIILPIILSIIVHLILKHTMLGREIYAIGGNINAARIAGINVMKIRFIIYMAIGFLTGIAGISNVVLIRVASSTSLMGSEMMVIAAVVIGGTRITGGHGSVIGTVLGVLLIALISNNLIMLGVPNYWQAFSVGIIIVIGTSITSLRAKRVALSQKK
ncbi:MAG: ABC transporter permease [Bacillota bacterium]|nr:ABC transporter permease [Bacillota bacterium]